MAHYRNGDLSPYEYVVLNHAQYRSVVYQPTNNLIPHGVYRGLCSRGLLQGRGTGWTITEKGRSLIADINESQQLKARLIEDDDKFLKAVLTSSEGKVRPVGVSKRSDMTTPARLDRPPTHVPGRGE